MTVEQYRNVVIGSGEAGKILAWNLSKRGESSIVVERSMVGGSCPNVACLPSKNVIYSAKALALMSPDRGLGIAKGSVSVDMSGVFRRKRAMIDGLVELHHNLFKGSGVELVMGEGRFVGERTVEVALNGGGTRQLSGERVILCLGSRAAIPDVQGLAAAAPMTHVEALNLQELPRHLVIIGGGYIGLEFAQAMRRFGSQVTVIQRGARLLEREDADVVAALTDALREEEIEILTECELLGVKGTSGAGVTLRVRTGGGECTIDATDILVSTGRTPNTDRVDIAKGGVKLDARGYVQVNEKLETSAAGVWAVGDCAGSPQFTHAAFDDFRVVFANLTGGQRTTTGRLIPYCLFTDPELAHVGLSEADARGKGVRYRIAKLPMASVLRTRTLSQTRGFAKALIGDDDRILGFTVLGAEATEMMAVVQTAMIGKMPYTALRDAIFTHPTAAEGLVGLFSGRLTEPGE